jgi:hypothetical protein
MQITPSRLQRTGTRLSVKHEVEQPANQTPGVLGEPSLSQNVNEKNIPSTTQNQTSEGEEKPTRVLLQNHQLLVTWYERMQEAHWKGLDGRTKQSDLSGKYHWWWTPVRNL